MSGAFTPELERCEIVAAAAPIPAFADGKRSTSLGTPCSPAWDDAHIAKVEAAEAQLNRRVCGARNLAGQPNLRRPLRDVEDMPLREDGCHATRSAREAAMPL